MSIIQLCTSVSILIVVLRSPPAHLPRVERAFSCALSRTRERASIGVVIDRSLAVLTGAHGVGAREQEAKSRDGAIFREFAAETRR